jgi:hypothetical protein
MLSSTPILNRENPMPQQKQASDRSAALFGAVLGILVLALELNIWFFCLSWFVGVAIHESGHFLAGRIGGMRFSYIRFGPVQIHSSWKLSWHWREALSGMTGMLPGSSGLERRTLLLLCAGGPAASFVSAALALCLQTWSTGPSEPWRSYAAASFLVGLITITPYRSRIGDSDGKRIWALLTDKSRVARWSALYELHSAMEGVVDYDEVPSELIEKVTAFNDDSGDTVPAHSIAFCIAVFGPDTSKAAGHLEACLAASAYCSVIMRHVLICNSALFQARKNGRIDLAEGWLDDLGRFPSTSDLPLRIESAILEAQGDLAGALAKLSEIEAILQKIPNPRQREISLRLLARWKADMPESAEARTASV